MRNYKLFILNIYTVLNSSSCITLMALLVSVFLVLTSCNENVTNRPLIVKNTSENSGKAVNINNASISELETLPGIGEEFARRIIEHRGKNGKFQRVEGLILVRGMSDKRFRELRDLVKVE